MHWWDGIADERYWCEITDRPDIGADLKCPQANEAGQSYWSYSLIRDIAAGDIVFHYSTREQAFVSASVAGAPLEDREIVWVPHGTAGRGTEGHARAGWWLPLHGNRSTASPLGLKDLRTTETEAWIAEWMQRVKKVAAPSAPFQLYPGGLRAAQGYLTKMPREFVDRWSQLSGLADQLEPLQEVLDPLQLTCRPVALEFKPKSDAPYLAVVAPAEQRRTRKHERLVRCLGEHLQARGAAVATSRHPIDLWMAVPEEVAFEAKIVGPGGALAAIRDAVGQLYEYSHFMKLDGARLCIVLDVEPDADAVAYVEEYLELAIAWWVDGELRSGPRSASWLPSLVARTQT